MLQAHNQFAAFFEIYKIFALLHHSRLQIFARFDSVCVCVCVCAKIMSNFVFAKYGKSGQHSVNFSKMWSMLAIIDELCRTYYQSLLWAFRIWSDAKLPKSCRSTIVEKCCNMSSSWFIHFKLQRIGFDTAQNEPSKVCCKGLTPYNYHAWITYSQPSYSSILHYLEVFTAPRDLSAHCNSNMSAARDDPWTLSSEVLRARRRPAWRHRQSELSRRTRVTPFIMNGKRIRLEI